MVEHLTKSELAIMEVMWDQEDALTATEIIKVSGDKEWKNSSVHLLVNALLEKKLTIRNLLEILRETLMHD